jgi:hypothetical protein
MGALYFPLKLRIGCQAKFSFRCQSGGPPTDDDLSGCTVVGTIWQAQLFTSPIVSISLSASTYGVMTITPYAIGLPPSVVGWQWLPAAVAALSLQPPLNELRLSWGVDIYYPAMPNAPDAFIRGPCTVTP